MCFALTNYNAQRVFLVPLYIFQGERMYGRFADGEPPVHSFSLKYMCLLMARLELSTHACSASAQSSVVAGGPFFVVGRGMARIRGISCARSSSRYSLA